MNSNDTARRITKQAHLRWVKLGELRVNPLAQRQLNQARVDKLAAEFDEEWLGYPTVNNRDGVFYLIDGQHRCAALRKWLNADDWAHFEVQCYTYDGDDALTEQEEAEVFLRLSDTLRIATFEKFRVAVTSGRREECDIDRIVRAQGLRISKDKGAIRAVAALRKVYRYDPATLARSLRIIRDAYGDAGLEGPFIEGFGLLCQRYNGELDEATAVAKLGRIHGGANGLMTSAEKLRARTGWARAHCIAASAVEVYNRGRGGKKLPTWGRSHDTDQGSA